MKFAVNVSTMFTETPFLARFAKARQHGFSLVECQFPYAAAPEAIACELEAHELSLLLINLPAGDWEKGERGLAIFPDRHEAFQRALEEGLRYAVELGVPHLHCMAGVVPKEMAREQAKETYMRRIDEAAAALAVHGLTLMIEPINPFDMPGYFLTDIAEAAAIIRDLGRPNIKLQYDIYHMARLGFDVAATFAAYEPLIAHVQFADAPGRHEPGTGALPYREMFAFLQKRGYNGAIGLEYIPSRESSESLGWYEEYRRQEGGGR
ncbi:MULTISPECIES: hydroxypyruvate isomerase family protein [unclassified Geobacillus]|uniref:hydroxypyruvate isomerase family protein n=1 Tax=unclassified Geobacillus TaxID=2642459 RepID=UPI0011A00AD0|nr:MULTISPECIES: hydroxypyruvate isomerase family protein [unclassified Geobacillus]NNU82895.1 hydroxypyruvate isomerase family protein [Geobacillus sp. BMUD]NNV06439.1 hydroxypyruvate isomerase family protein [Geobacillus sp. MMMUD3]TWG30376.1 hydroxypyruvate isomerase [Geobacillus sp. C56-T2]